jgi:hypothetical protein
MIFACGIANAEIIGHYTFDDPANPGADSSGNGNNANGTNNVNNGDSFVTNGVSGDAAYFAQGGSSYLSWTGTTNPIAKVLAGDFSFSLWLKTTETFGSDTDEGYQDAGIVYADVPGGPNDTIPMSLTGTKLGFDTGTPSDVTVHSISDIDTSNYVFLVVTREFSTGLNSIYVNGILEAQANHSAGDDLSGRSQLALGGNLTDGRYFYGEIDDFQVYNEALSVPQIFYLFGHPGQTAPSRVQLVSPQILGTNFAFSFQTANNVNYIVQSTTNLVNANWTNYSTLTGDGTVKQIFTPGTNTEQFFRVDALVPPLPP